MRDDILPVGLKADPFMEYLPLTQIWTSRFVLWIQAYARNHKRRKTPGGM